MKTELDSIRIASARPLPAARNAVSISFGPSMSRYSSFTFDAPAASSVSFNTCAWPGLVEVPRTATREDWEGFPSEAPVVFRLTPPKGDNPVMLPPGRARLATNPVPTGSDSVVMTIGIVFVASLDARVSANRRDDEVYLETH